MLTRIKYKKKKCFKKKKIAKELLPPFFNFLLAKWRLKNWFINVKELIYQFIYERSTSHLWISFRDFKIINHLS